MLMDWCIGKAAADIKEFYLLPVGDKLVQYDALAVNTIVKNRNGEVNSCDIRFNEDMEAFNQEYLKYSAEVAETCADRDLSEDCMVIGTSVRSVFVTICPFLSNSIIPRWMAPMPGSSCSACRM